MELQKLRFTVGQMVYGKLKGYPPWPAVITKIEKNMAKIVYFNANKEFSTISFNKLTPFHAGGKIVEKYHDRNLKFTKAYNEMRAMLQIKMKDQSQERKKMEKSKQKSEKKQIEPSKNLRQNCSIILDGLTPNQITEVQRKLKQNESKKNYVLAVKSKHRKRCEKKNNIKIVQMKVKINK